MIHNTFGIREDYMSEKFRREQIGNPLINFNSLNIEPRRYNSGLIESTQQVYNTFVASPIVNNGKRTNVAMFLHLLKELNNHRVHRS